MTNTKKIEIHLTSKEALEVSEALRGAAKTDAAAHEALKTFNAAWSKTLHGLYFEL